MFEMTVGLAGRIARLNRNSEQAFCPFLHERRYGQLRSAGSGKITRC